MGFFDRSVICGTCGEKTGLNRYKTAEGWICPKCFKECGYTMSTPIKKKTQIEINNDLNALKTKKVEFSEFKATKVVGTTLEFNDDDKLWLVKPQGVFSKKKVPKIRKYSDILDFELLEDGETLTTKNGVGRAIVGGVLFGGVGAIVGGVTGKNKNKNICNSLKLKITLNDLEEPAIYVDYVTSPTKKDGFVYKTIAESAQNAVSILSIILEENSKQLNNNNNNPNSEFSVADEILKFKSLLDQGIVTQEEFDLKKKELLNL